ncbi:helix-turn-helix domain-containing protein [Salinimonas lutimaris]|uniref:helix-turn-helix domain-containing protein n=1 Tax=Salinimonas lutimaris TaxID=914153 RepID=UPI001C30A6C2|nr:helix-turn-helix domain-containing protein [Salinimonas lutimaris]
MNKHSEPATSAFGRLLRFWRQVQQKNQEDLAYSIESSPRHISRLENGHVQPSQEMVLKIAGSLALKERDTNHLLIAAGFTPQPGRVDFHSPQLKWLRKAMVMTLRALDPYPSVLINGAGDILMVNRSWVSFYQAVAGTQALDEVTNHFDFLFSLPATEDASEAWKDALSLILMSMQQDVLLGSNQAVEPLLDRLSAQPQVPSDWARRAALLDPMASFRIPMKINGQSQIFYNVNQTVGAMGPTAYVSEPRLTISSLYPQDETAPPVNTDHTSVKHPLLFY